MNLNLDNVGNALNAALSNLLSKPYAVNRTLSLPKKIPVSVVKKSVFILILQLLAMETYALEYSGVIGNSPIHFSIERLDQPDGAVYMYDQHNEPIRLIADNSNQTKEIIKLVEGLDYAHPNQLPSAQITLQLDPNSPEQLTGEWQNIQTKLILPIHLSQYVEPAGLLQSRSFKKALIRKKCTEYQDDKVVHIYDKKTHQLLDTIQTGGECRGDEVHVGDYNFDGYQDFSVYSEGFAGANSKNIYVLYNPLTHHYESNDELNDVSLSFDPKHKIVTSTNQCCSGRQTLIQRYTWKKNKLKKLDSSCLIYNELTNRFIRYKSGKFCE